MPFQPFSFKLFSFLAFILLIQSCEPEKPGMYNNDRIKAGLRSDLHELNATLFAGIKENDAKHLAGIMSKDFIDDNSKFRTVELLYNRMKEDSSYAILDEYYIVNDQKGKHTINADNKGTNNYKYDYDADTREMYIVFFAPKIEPNRYLFTAVYNKFDYGWKLTSLDLGRYTTNGKTAPELFKLAKKQYGEKYLADAMNSMTEAYECLRPSNSWQYPDEANVTKFYSEISDKINKKYNFPYTLTKVGTKPQIFRILTQKTVEGVFPMIYYLSDIKLSNTTALIKENGYVQKMIGQAFPGIDKDNRYIFYSVFNQLPDGTKTFDHYDITEKF